MSSSIKGVCPRKSIVVVVCDGVHVAVAGRSLPLLRPTYVSESWFDVELICMVFVGVWKLLVSFSVSSVVLFFTFSPVSVLKSFNISL